MKRSRTRSLAAAALATLTVVAILGSCARTGLERWPPKNDRARDDKLQVEGNLCTREPESLIFPLRVLFIVDGSESMEITDPQDPVTLETARERAVRETWTALLDQGVEGVRIGILRFSAQAQSRTPVDRDGDGLSDSYFTTDRAQLDAATIALGVTDRTTNYLNALSEAYFELRTEMLQADLESLPLSKYVVIFLSDGLPDVDDEEVRENSTENILESVIQLNNLAKLFHVGDFSFHTAYLSAGAGPAVDQPAQELLQQMADVGGGTYRSFPNGEALNFVHIDLSIIRRVFTLKTLAALNTSALMDQGQAPLQQLVRIDLPAFVDLDGSGGMGCGEALVDTDGDGLADHIEQRIGSDPFVPDTDDDGLNDRVEWDFRNSGHDPIDPGDADCFIPEPCLDCGIDGICPGQVGYTGVDAGEGDGICECIRDRDRDGVCNCVDDPDVPCMNAAGRDCLDADLDGWCDCPDLDGNGLCDWEDTDGDMLRDCEEVFFGSSHNGSDSDADGLPDTLEVRFRTSPVKKDDHDDLDFDLTPNGTEVLSATDPLCDDSAFRSAAAYRYRIEDLGLDGDVNCYNFDISNITLLPTRPNPNADYPGNGWNRVLFFAGEVAFDDPTSFAVYRVGCVEASYIAEGDYKNPPSGRMRLEQENFIDVREFDPTQHCVRPEDL